MQAISLGGHVEKIFKNAKEQIVINYEREEEVILVMSKITEILMLFSYLFFKMLFASFFVELLQRLLATKYLTKLAFLHKRLF